MQPSPDPAQRPPTLELAKVVGLGLILLACMSTLFVDVGPSVDPLLSPSIDPNNRQGFRCVCARVCARASTAPRPPSCALIARQSVCRDARARGAGWE